MPLGAARASWTASVQCPLSDGWDWPAPSPSSLKFFPSVSALPQILPRNIFGLGYMILKDHPTPAPARPGTSRGCSEQNSRERSTAPGRPSLLLRGPLRAADGEGSAAALRGGRPGSPGLRRTRDGLPYAIRAPYSGNLPPEGAPSPTGRLPVRGSRVPPSGPPQVSKEAQRLLPSLLLPSPLGVATRRLRARPSLRLVRSHTAPCFQVPYKTSQPGRERNGHSQLHYIFHHGRHLPGSSPSGREARSPQRAGAGPAERSNFLVLLRRRHRGACARERATENELLPGSPRPGTLGTNAQAQWRRARAPRLLLLCCLSRLVRREKGGRI